MYQYNYLMHWGIKGMKWGIRRYQNEDGTWTEAGKVRRARLDAKAAAKEDKLLGREKKKTARFEQKQLMKRAAEIRREQVGYGKSVLEMSDADLAKYTARLKAEQTYQEMMAQANPDRTKKAKELVSKFSKKSASIIGKLVSGAAEAAVDKFVQKMKGNNGGEGKEKEKGKGKQRTKAEEFRDSYFALRQVSAQTQADADAASKAKYEKKLEKAASKDLAKQERELEKRAKRLREKGRAEKRKQDVDYL